MIMRGKVSSIENDKYRITYPDRENLVSKPLQKASHIGSLEIGNDVIVVYPDKSNEGIIIATF